MSNLGGAEGRVGESAESDDDDWEPEPRPLWVKVALAAAVLAVIGLAVGIGVHLTQSSGSTTTTTIPAGPEGVPIQNVADLASPDSTVKGTPVDGIPCRVGMDPVYHVHVHLDIFVDGQQKRLPAGAGIKPPRVTQQQPGGTFTDNGPGGCDYYLHVHADDGIIHVEAPSKQDFTLGQFFDIWGQALGPNQVGPATGPVTVFVNGRIWNGNVRDVPLAAQSAIQLDVGTPVVAFQPITFKVTGSCSTTCSLGS